MRLAAALLAAALLVPGTALACAPVEAGSLTISDGWARAVPQGGTTAIYLTIANAGEADTLTGVAFGDAKAAELHETANENGGMQMRKVDALTIAANGTTQLAPGGAHIMLIGVTSDLVADQCAPVTLTFATAGTVEARFTPKSPADAAKAMQTAGSHGGHQH